MTHAQLKEFIIKLKAKQGKFEHGLSDNEIQQIENKFNLNFLSVLLYRLEILLTGVDGFIRRFKSCIAFTHHI